MLIIWRAVRVVEGARLEIVYTYFMYHGFKSHALRHALDGELAVPYNLQSAVAGLNSQWRDIFKL